MPRRNNQACAARIRDPGVLAIQLEVSGGECEQRGDIPLRTDLLVGELFGLKKSRRRRQGAELIAGSRQIRDGVAAVERQWIDRLDDDARAWRHQIIGPRERLPEQGRDAPTVEIGVVQSELLEASPADELQPTGEFDLVLQVAR